MSRGQGFIEVHNYQHVPQLATQSDVDSINSSKHQSGQHHLHAGKFNAVNRRKAADYHSDEVDVNERGRQRSKNQQQQIGGMRAYQHTPDRSGQKKYLQALMEDAGNSRHHCAAGQSCQWCQRVDDDLTFYGKPVFESGSEMEVLQERFENSGTVPYPHREIGPWLTSLRRPVNYQEIRKLDAKQQRLQKKLEERYPPKSYSDMFNDRKLTDAGNIAANGMTPCGGPHGPRHSNPVSVQTATPSSLPTFLPPVVAATAANTAQPVTLSTSDDGRKLPSSLPSLASQLQDQHATPHHPPPVSDAAQPLQHPPFFTAPPALFYIPHPACTDTQQPGYGIIMCHPQQPQMAHHGQLCQVPLSSCYFPSNMTQPGWPVPALDASNGRPGGPAGEPAVDNPQQQQQQLQYGSENGWKSHRHVKQGRHGDYRVYCVDDYRKVKQEMRLASEFGAPKQKETLLEKQEKWAVKQEYGKLVSARNQRDFLRTKRLQMEAAASAI